jgi:hypothetical protein
VHVPVSAGLTLLKEHAAGTIARQLQAAGISALAYDHRSFSSSDFILVIAGSSRSGDGAACLPRKWQSPW